jgi:DNA-binding MarR family transcriptional regulator/N-acetylglutamate synthase-like GNAT family acetyltransferase
MHESEVAAMSAFTRLYTSRLGLLSDRINNNRFTLSEALIFCELADHTEFRAADIACSLRIDRAEINRALKRLASRGLVEASRDPLHRRHRLMSLTQAGRAACAALDTHMTATLGALLKTLPPVQGRRLLSAADTITRMLEAEPATEPILRGLAPGDIGWIIHRQALLYAQEYGWNRDYEALAARILADFHQSFDPAYEAAWIAEMGGVIVGSVFLVRADEDGVAKLRLLYVEPDARGAGIGKMLVAACIDRARTVGYRRLELWTNSVLTTARHIYEQAGFELVAETPHHSFGQDLVGQTWALDLRPRPHV